jgi:hypothetical protein
MTTISFFKTFLIIFIIGAVSACSSTSPYTSSSPDNLSIKTEIRKGTAWMNVYEVNNACATKYMGTVDLEGAKVKVAIPINKPSYLLFTFADASLFAGSSRSSYGIYLTTRAGYQYDATVSYVDDMYTLMIHEQNTRGGDRREITRIVPTACASK